MLLVLGPWERARARAASRASVARVTAAHSAGLDLSALHARVEGALARWPVDRPRISRHAGLLLVDALPPRAMFAALAVVLRGDAWACGVFLRPPTDPRLSATHLIGEARKSAWGVAVRRDPSDPAALPVHAALGPHATLLRQRSEAVWTAVDAVSVHRTATAAARELGCAQQTVSRHLARADLAAAAQTRVVVEALLAAR